MDLNVPLEIERKFLIANDSWKDYRVVQSTLIMQGYLQKSDESVIRLRFEQSMTYGFGRDNSLIEACVTNKSKLSGTMLSRIEREHDISYQAAILLLPLFDQHGVVIKMRNFIVWDSRLWMVDQFLCGKHIGLTLSECEFRTEAEALSVNDNLPPWVGEDVTEQPAFVNSNLVDSELWKRIRLTVINQLDTITLVGIVKAANGE